MKPLTSIAFCILLISLLSCDAVNRMGYLVRNSTDKPIYIRVPNYSRDMGGYAASKLEIVDTVIQIMPKESVLVNLSPMDIDFPWATKNIYRKTPGVCGLEQVEKDSIIPLGCSEEDWKYKRRTSILKIK